VLLFELRFDEDVISRPSWAASPLRRPFSASTCESKASAVYPIIAGRHPAGDTSTREEKAGPVARSCEGRGASKEDAARASRRTAWRKINGQGDTRS
jgi:hypothetical protein